MRRSRHSDNFKCRAVCRRHRFSNSKFNRHKLSTWSVRFLYKVIFKKKLRISKNFFTPLDSLNALYPATTASTTFVVERKPPTPQQQPLQKQTPFASASPAQQVQAVAQQPQQLQTNRPPSTSSSMATTNVHESSGIMFIQILVNKLNSLSQNHRKFLKFLASTTTLAQAQMAPESLQVGT